MVRETMYEAEWKTSAWIWKTVLMLSWIPGALVVFIQPRRRQTVRSKDHLISIVQSHERVRNILFCQQVVLI